MSEITTYHTEIRLSPSQCVSVNADIKGSICLETLRMACEKTARAHGGHVSQSYRDNRGEIHRCLLAVHTKDFPQGIGLQLHEDGQISFQYDVYGGDNQVAEAICRQIKQSYVTIALLRSLHQIGFYLEASERQVSSFDRVIVISGKKWTGERLSVAIDKQGDVKLDFVGYPANSCTKDEATIRRTLEAHNLRIEVKESRQKREEPLAAWKKELRELIRCDE